MTPEKLKQLRVDKGYTQKELSEAIHMTIETISRLENGRGDIRPAHAILMQLLPDKGSPEWDDITFYQGASAK